MTDKHKPGYVDDSKMPEILHIVIGPTIEAGFNLFNSKLRELD